MGRLTLNDPWFPAHPQRFGEEELQREVSRGHPLHGVAAKSIARRYDCDDVAFQLVDGTYAVVHLTWSQHVEPAPSWPRTDLYKTLDTLQARIDADVADIG